MLFKGSPGRSALRIAQDFDAVGGDVNAYTTKEFTCVHARTLGADVGLAIDTIADIMQRPSLDPNDLEVERGVVLEEVAMHEDTHEDLVYDLFHEAVWPQHPLGRRIQGYASTVESLGRDDVAAFHAARYLPGPLVVSFAGDIAHDDAVRLVQDAFTDRAATEPQPMVTAPGPIPGALALTERDIEQAHVVYGTRGVARGDERRWALWLLNVALGGGMSSRLFQEIREKRGLAYAVGSGVQGFAEIGSFTIYAGCASDKVGEVLRIARDQVAAVAAEGITTEELARARGHVRGNLVSSLDEAGSMMTHLGKSELLLDRVETTDELLAHVEAVTMDDVRRIGHEVLAGGPWSLAVLGPALGEDVSGFVGEAA